MFRCCFLYFYRSPYRSLSECTESIIFTKFSGLVDLLVQMIDLIFAFQSIKGRCYSNQSWAESAKLAYRTSIHRICNAFWDGSEDRNADEGVNTGDDPFTSDGNLVRFDRVTP